MHNESLPDVWSSKENEGECSDMSLVSDSDCEAGTCRSIASPAAFAPSPDPPGCHHSRRGVGNGGGGSVPSRIESVRDAVTRQARTQGIVTQVSPVRETICTFFVLGGLEELWGVVNRLGECFVNVFSDYFVCTYKPAVTATQMVAVGGTKTHAAFIGAHSSMVLRKDYLTPLDQDRSDWEERRMPKGFVDVTPGFTYRLKEEHGNAEWVDVKATALIDDRYESWCLSGPRDETIDAIPQVTCRKLKVTDLQRRPWNQPTLRHWFT